MLNTPVDPAGICVGNFPADVAFPLGEGGSASTSVLSRPARASLVLRPARLLSHPRWLLSQGSDLPRCRAKPLVSYQIYRQLSGWDFHPLAICAVGAHFTLLTFPRSFQSIYAKICSTGTFTLANLDACPAGHCAHAACRPVLPTDVDDFVAPIQNPLAGRKRSKEYCHRCCC